MSPSLELEPEAPEQEAEQQPDYGPDNRNLPHQLVDAIKAAILEFQSQEKASRRREVRNDRRNRFYESGYQHILWREQGQGGFQILTPGGLAYNQAGESVQCPAYMDAYNIFFPYFRILQSVLTQNLPGVDFQPIDPSNPDDQDKSKAAQDYAALFDRQNDVPELQAQMVRMFGMSGRCVSWTRTEQDAQRFGYEADGITPKSFQRTTIHGTLETKVPIMCRELDRNCLYVIIYEDPDVKKAKDDFPWIKDEIKAGAGLGENTYERTARLGVLNGSRSQNQVGDSLTHLVTVIHAFLRPAAFTGPAYDNACDDDPRVTVGERLRQLFPQGCRAIFVGEVYAASYAESMDDHLDIQWPYQGDGMFRQAFMDSMIVVQENFNDLCNWIREKIDTGAGATWINGNQQEVDAVTSQRAAPNAIRPAKDFAMQGQPLEDAFWKEPDPQIPDTLFKLLEFLRGQLPEFLLAALPSLQGGQMADNKTASGYAQANAQAKGQLAIIWSRMQRMFARIRYQSALAASKEDGQDMVTIPGEDGGQAISVNLANLRKGSFGCYPDKDSTFPESTAQKRAIMANLIELGGQSQTVAQLLDNPDNVDAMKRLNGFPELVLLPSEARNKQLHEIELLLQQAPLPPSPEELQAAQDQYAAALAVAQATGQPAPAPPNPQGMLRSSVPVDELDYHQWEFAKCQEWLSSAARRQEDQKGNQAGVQNVKLHALEHRKFISAMAAQMQPAPVPVQVPEKKEPALAEQPEQAPLAQPAAPAI